VSEIGLFPLDIVLVPGERAPLHIFEDRYRELIGECVEMDTEFGVVLAEEPGFRAVGTKAAVIDVTDRFPDGRMNILVEGRGRFRIEQVTEGRPFVTAEVEDLDDEDPAEDPTREETARLLDAYRRVVEVADAEPPQLDLTAESLAFQIAARVDFGSELKQELLESLSERERTLQVAALLDAAVEAMKLQRTIRERAAGNGHVPEA
jgi:Lon protease-like protein